MGMQILPFAFQGNPVRVLEIDSDPWFVAKDVALALKYANPQKAVRDHCRKTQDVGGARNVHPSNKGGSRFVTPSDLDPQTKIIPEGDVYRLIIRSNRPEAEAFETLVMEEILPTIRKTGSYGAQLPKNYEQALEGLLGKVRENNALMIENAEKDAAISAMKPAADAYGAYLSEEGVCRIGDFCNKHGVKINHPGKVLRERAMMKQNKVQATQVGIKSGIIKNVMDKNGFQYIDSNGQSVESQLAMIVRQREVSLLKMIVDAYGMTAFRNPAAFERAKILIGGEG